MSVTKKQTLSQRKAAANLLPCYGQGLRSTIILDECGSLWIEVEQKPRTDLEKELVATYGLITRVYLIRRSGKVMQPNCWSPVIETAIYAYSNRATYLPR